jgi:hypothetical protein
MIPETTAEPFASIRHGKVTSSDNVAGLMDPATRHRTKQKFGSLDEGHCCCGRTIGRHWKRSGGELGKMGENYFRRCRLPAPPYHRGLRREQPQLSNPYCPQRQ